MYAFSDFTFNHDDSRGFVTSDDPRIVAVIEQDTTATLGESFDGDAILPIYSRDYRSNSRLDFEGGYRDDTVANAWIAAYSRAPWTRRTDGAEFADRFVAAFHGAKVAHTSGGYRPDFEVLVFDTVDYRKHIGCTADGTGNEGLTTSQEWADETAREVSRALDGEVYGIGYAVNESRTTTETPIPDDLDGWDVTIECWGFIGNDYAAEAARTFEAGRPDLHPMLPNTDPALISA